MIGKLGIAGLFVKAGLALLIVNEIRGLVMAIPIFYAMYQSGGTLMSLWLGFCSLVGTTLSVAVPIFVARKFNLAGSP
jgi:hypothetical protein